MSFSPISQCCVLTASRLVTKPSLSALPTRPSALRLDSCTSWRSLHGTGSFLLPRRRDFFSSNASLSQSQPAKAKNEDAESLHGPKKRSARSPASKTSLRRVAVEAQRSREGAMKESATSTETHKAKTVTAYCAAERYDISAVAQILKSERYKIDPFQTGLYPQVVHIRVAQDQETGVASKDGITKTGEAGDVFIFPSGTVVAWAVPDIITSHLVKVTLLPAAENPHLREMEKEDLDYVEDPSRENSSIKGDTIILGTKPTAVSDLDTISGSKDMKSTGQQQEIVDDILAKIAFSSGLARSTKLAVLETLLGNYFDSTRSIPTLLSRGSRLPYTRSFILRKTGQLLSLRAQLNLYSELTDSLPDIFWDSRHDLGLEGYYDQVGRALDVGIRIKTLNEKMDYAQEIASVLRERLSEKHGLVLEWMIIALIAVEVGFEINRLWKERREEKTKDKDQLVKDVLRIIEARDAARSSVHVPAD